MTEEERRERQRLSRAKYYASEKGRNYLRAWYQKHRERLCQEQREKRTANIEKTREATRRSVAKWRAANPEKAKAAQVPWRERNREYARLKSQKWREDNPGRVNEMMRKRYWETRELRIAETLAWVKANPQKRAIIAANYHARKKHNGGTISPDIVERLLPEQGNKCCYCWKDFTAKRRPHMDHFMPLALGGANDDSNIVLSCRRCNCSKRHTHPLVFLSRVGIGEWDYSISS